MEKFQSALYRHYESGGQSLYRSDDMQGFCETCEPHLFYILISTIVSVIDMPPVRGIHIYSSKE